MQPVRTYHLEVDMYRNNSFIRRSLKDRLYQRPEICGRWYVGAKSEKEAKKLLQEHLGFAKISIPKRQYVPEKYQNTKKFRKNQPDTKKKNDAVVCAILFWCLCLTPSLPDFG